MQKEAQIYEHPNKTPPDGRGKTHVYGHLLETEDILQTTDMYSSSNGYWEPCPCPGLRLTVSSGGPVWVRPA